MAEKIEVLETPTKSDSDKKDYRLIRIKENGLRVLLISHGDPDKKNEISNGNGEKTSEKLAAVAVAASVGGHYDNRSGVLGMAHFLEHMLFLGTKKYPDEHYFENYVKSNGGIYNANTMSDHTVYFFSIDEDHLEGGVDCFSQFFINPLMRKESMNRERQAVDSEFQTRFDIDYLRVEIVASTFGTPGHPSTSFVCGNSKTLKDNITDDELYEKVHDFRKKHYLGERMSVSIQSALSLNELEDLAVKYFSDVPKATKLEPLYSEISEFTYKNAFNSNFHDKMCYMGSRSGNKILTITWCLPPFVQHYRTAPEKFLTHLLSYDGPGGFERFMKKNSLSERCYILFNGMSSVYSTLNLFIILTENGSKNIGKILEGLFSYLLLIQQNGTDEVILQDLQKIMKNEFKFREEKDTMTNVQINSRYVLTCAPKDVLIGPNVFSEIDLDFLKTLINELNNGKFNLTYFTPDQKEFNKKEKWTGMDYAEVDLPEEYQILWDNRKLNEEFKLPSQNPYIPTNFEIFFNESMSGTIKPCPEIIMENDVAEVWYRLDDKFLLPKANVKLCLVSPHFCETTYNFIVRNLYIEIINELMEEILDPIDKVGNKVKIEEYGRNLTISIEGYDDKIGEICETVCENFIKCMENFDEKTFIDCKEKFKNMWREKLKMVNYFNMILLNDFLECNEPSKIQQLKIIDKISYEDIKHFANVWRQQAQLKVLIQGNILQKNATKISNKMLDILKLQKIDEDLLESRTFQVPIGKHCYKTKTLMQNSRNSMTSLYYQVGENSYKSRALLDLLHEIVGQPLFDTLRTQQQLGYSVNGKVHELNNCIAYQVNVVHQEDKFSTKLVSERIEEFTEMKIYEILSKMDEETFENFKKATAQKKLVPHDNLNKEFKYNWTEITSEDYEFDRKPKLAAAIEKVTKENLLEFYEYYFRSTNSRKLELQVCGSNSDSGQTDSNDDGTIFIEDPAQFKNSMYAFPILKSNF